MRGRRVEMQLLGSPTVYDGSRQRRVAGRQGALLAALTLYAPQPVSAGRLVEVVWGADPPEDGANALQQRISRLRAIVDPGRRGGVLVPAAGGYALQIDDGWIDARRFEQLAAAGHRQLIDGAVRAAEGTLTQALNLWRGPALEGFADEPWAVGESRRLDELRLAALENRADARLGLGDHEGAIAGLIEAAANNPLREPLRGRLMLALYRAGRQADALALYDETRRLLAEELGVDPGPQLQAVYHEILSQGADLVVESPSPAPPARGNLPAPRSRVVGRDHEVEQITQLMPHTRLLTATGPGGAGKTTLAVEAARRRQPPRDGTWLVELAPLSAGDAVAPVIAEVLGMTRAGLGAASVDPAALARALTGKQIVLVLDNCEHLLHTVSPLVEQLLAAAAGLQVLATSREPLGLVGEVVWSVPGLGLPSETDTTAEQVMTAPAVTLLVERARAHTAGFVLTEDTACAAATLTRRLDGIPLAIELAAARLRVLSLAEVNHGLDDRFGMLAGGNRTAPSRHRTLRAALDWSWYLLDVPLQRAWCALAVPAGRFDATMASALLAAVDTDADALNVLADLVDRSLLIADTAETPTRYRMLESVRDYGREHLAEQARASAVHVAHAGVVEVALAGCHAGLSAENFAVDVGAMSAWLDDARAALRWAHEHGERHRVQRIAGLLGWLWLLRGASDEGLAWLDRGLGAPDGVDPYIDDGAALFWASALRAATVAADGGRWADLAVRAASAPPDHVLAQVCAAGHRLNIGQVRGALALLEACVDEAEAVGGWQLGFHRLITAQVDWAGGDVDAARVHAEDAERLLSAAGADWARVHALETLVDDAGVRGECLRARDLALDGLRICRRQRYPELECAMLVHAGFAAYELGEPVEGARYVEEAVLRAAAVGSGSGLANARLAAGTLARRRGQIRVAREHLHAAVGLAAEAHIGPGLARAHRELAHLAAGEGETETAMIHARRALAIARRMGDPRSLVLAAEALAGGVATTDDPGAAVSLLAAATAVRGVSRLPADPVERHDIQRVTDLLRAGLGAAAFDQAWAAAHTDVGDRPDDCLCRLLDAHAEAAGT